ncbi:MAG: hypothetical protein ACJA0E_001943 [Bermanella sp.]|jgi:hypothetical protein
MIRMDSGHLGSGTWKVKQQEGVDFLSHRLPFSPRNEFRIGSNEIVDVKLQSIEKDKYFIKIILTDERSCFGLTDKINFDALLKMAQLDLPAPIEDRNVNAWMRGLGIFIAAVIVFELVK